MSKKECDIIKDLLPSYVDEICSEASKEWVEEHLAECEECRALAEVMKHTEISARKLELKQLEAGRKVIRQNLRRSIFHLGLCLLIPISIRRSIPTICYLRPKPSIKSIAAPIARRL